jgi:Phosphotransferase enzyme family
MRRAAEGAPAQVPDWRPASVPAQFLGFDTAIGPEALSEGCRRLEVRRVGAPLVSFTRRAIGSRVLDGDDTTGWVKVNALIDVDTNWLRCGEEEAGMIRDMPKPELLRISDWSQGRLSYRALLMSFAPSPAIEFGPLAGKTASAVSDTWIEEVRQAVEALRAIETTRHRIAPDSIPTRIKRWFGSDVPVEADCWHPAHGDMNWGNMTSPTLCILDWETWGLAPQGFDLAYLLAYSCADGALCARLEAAFASELATPSARLARLLALGELMSNVQQGWFPEPWGVAAERMAERVLADSRDR